jgi:hypothetical protein
LPKQKIIKKSNLDKFYTKSEIAKSCLEELYEFTNKDDLFIEPSAGSGSFFNQINSENKIGLDIEPDNDQILRQDWFSYEPERDCVIVGNPPFGSRNSLTNGFIKHGLKFAKIIAFILPAVYRKETMQKIFPDNWKLAKDIDVPKNAFILENEEYHVPCVFQIWIKDYHTNLRESVKPIYQTTDFEFVDKSLADWFMFGAAPNKIIIPSDVKSSNRGYYFNSSLEIKQKLENIKWTDYALSSVNGGAAWFTKKQIINIYGETYGK